MESEHNSEQGLDEGREAPQRDMVAPALRALWECIERRDGVVHLDGRPAPQKATGDTFTDPSGRLFDVLEEHGGGLIGSSELGRIMFRDQYGVGGEDKESDANESEALNPTDEASASAEEEEEDPFLKSIQKMINEVDKNGDGKIDFDEFKQAMKEDVSGSLFVDQENGKYGGLIGPKITE